MPATGTATPCVILDIGGALELTPDTGWVDRWERRLGLAPGAVRDRMHDVWAAGAVGDVSEREVHEQAAARLGLDARQTEAFMEDLWEEYLGTPNEELLAYVRGLRGRCRLGILSNSFVGAREREAAAYGFDALVEVIVYSHETGVNKPDRRAFDLVLGRLGVRAEDCLFVDDAAVNVEAARALGMRGHLYEGVEGAVARIGRHVREAGDGGILPRPGPDPAPRTPGGPDREGAS
ncbi:HAD family phosphatase [Streptomyces sp. MUM 203J]|uniref:HAD family hydrolase n=1 Tax=Streptomyces sp. MUM 203J TaxID=2791990 RepID=UPI001F03646B|nr:HAD family phosphatase [Streptomyces sp. MUM 203J]MCH0541718.1 HAD family phosphatase [Streptomyces sp. MUM 203J]